MSVSLHEITRELTLMKVFIPLMKGPTLRFKAFIAMVVVGLACIDFVATSIIRSIPVLVANVTDWWQWRKYRRHDAEDF